MDFLSLVRCNVLFVFWISFLDSSARWAFLGRAQAASRAEGTQGTRGRSRRGNAWGLRASNLDCNVRGWIELPHDQHGIMLFSAWKWTVAMLKLCLIFQGPHFFHDCWIHSTNFVRAHRGKRKLRLGLGLIAAVYLVTSVGQPVHFLHERYDVFNVGLLVTPDKLVRTWYIGTPSSQLRHPQIKLFSFATVRSRLKKMRKSMTRAVTIATLTRRLMSLMTGIKTRMMRRMKQPLGLLRGTRGSWWQLCFPSHFQFGKAMTSRRTLCRVNVTETGRYRNITVCLSRTVVVLVEPSCRTNTLHDSSD